MLITYVFIRYGTVNTKRFSPFRVECAIPNDVHKCDLAIRVLTEYYVHQMYQYYGFRRWQVNSEFRASLRLVGNYELLGLDETALCS